MNIMVVSKCVVVNPEGKILLLRRSANDARRPNEWDLPGGHVDEGEYPAEAAARETEEEAGIPVDPKDLALVYAMTEVPKEGLSVTWTFFVVSTNQKEVSVSDEHSEHAWVSLDEALAMIAYERQQRALKYIADNDLLTATPA